jgi:hypothetical protein
MLQGLPIQNKIFGRLVLPLLLVVTVAGQPKEQTFLPTGVHLDPVGAKNLWLGAYVVDPLWQSELHLKP